MHRSSFKKAITRVVALIVGFVFCLTALSGCADSAQRSAKNDFLSSGCPEGQEEGFIPVDVGQILYHLYGKDKTGIPMYYRFTYPLHSHQAGIVRCRCREYRHRHAMG